ncbi:TPA: SMI1/KNR4 family protein [Clostridium botulinum]|nr:SMI1/KNR4 family protein [Clostridium botulinum]
MSIYNYEKAIEIIKQNKSECFFVGQRFKNDIRLAEKAVGLKFSGMYKNFLEEYGAGSVGAEEIYGISSLNFENATVPNRIWYTLTERKESNLPLNLLVIYDTGGDELFCLDFNKLNEEDEPAVVAFIPGIDLKYQRYEIIAEDFGDFLLDRVIDAIESI